MKVSYKVHLGVKHQDNVDNIFPSLDGSMLICTRKDISITLSLKELISIQ